ncbi:MAG: hypothetical protein GEU73_17765, partial [Chloroflexi bacterium]|nr:hypothetical protein [Chloroflexota bacterium]
MVRRSVLVLVSCLTVGTLLPSRTAAQVPAPEAVDWQAVTDELGFMHQQHLFSGGGGQPVTFDKTRAQRLASPRAISLAEELAAAANEIAAGQGVRQDTLAKVLPRYPLLKAYLAAATERAKGPPSASEPNPVGEQQEEVGGEVRGATGHGFWACGN